MTRRSKECQRECIQGETFHFRPITDEDMEFLYRLYASTRLAEMAVTGWSESQVEEFLRMQFGLNTASTDRTIPAHLSISFSSTAYPPGDCMWTAKRTEC